MYNPPMTNSLDFNQTFQDTLNLLENTSQNLFITGKAGTGKSTLLNHFRTTTKKPFAVLAPTGVAAVNVQGETIHSFFGFSPSITVEDAHKVAKNKRSTEIYEKIQMLIIDEISMVRSDLLDCIDTFLRTIRANQEPFGNVQMVFIGDLFQLPPVVTQSEAQIFMTMYESPYFFDSHAVRNLIRSGEFEMVQLEKIYRQSDETFIEILNAVRNKTVNEEQLRILNKRFTNEPVANSNEYVYLTAINQQADEINRRNLEKIPGRAQVFEGSLDGDFSERSLPTDVDLKLKVGARVMFLNNDLLDRWINGTIGTVTKIEDDDFDPIVYVQIDNEKKVRVESNTWTNYTTVYNRETDKVEKKETGSFTQLPLKLAWAITIHKSQGKTFDKVIIDIGRGTFAHGQMYVALSRCRTLEGLILKTPIRPQHIIMDERIVEFMRSIK